MPAGAPKRDAPTPGSKNAYVAQHFKLDNVALLERAQADGVGLDRKAIDRIRHMLRTHYGYPHSAQSKAKSKASKAGWKASKRKPKKPKAAKAMPKHTPKARAAKRANGVSPAKAHKLAQVRKLVFELGFDDVRDIFLEFQEMHDRFGGG